MPNRIISVGLAVPAVVGTFGAPQQTASLNTTRTYEYQGAAGDVVDIYGSTDGVNYALLATFSAQQGFAPITIPDATGAARAFLRAGAGAGACAVSGEDLSLLSRATSVASIAIAVPAVVGTNGAAADVTSLDKVRSFSYVGAAADIVDLQASTDGGATFETVATFQGNGPVLTLTNVATHVRAHLRAGAGAGACSVTGADLTSGDNPPGTIIGSFTANASILTAVDQAVAPGNCAVMTDVAAKRPFIRMPQNKAWSVKHIGAEWIGNAANGAQTMEIAAQISTDHGTTWTDIPGMRFLLQPTALAGMHSTEIDLSTPQVIPIRALFSVIIRPSAPLTGALGVFSCTITT